MQKARLFASLSMCVVLKGVSDVTSHPLPPCNNPCENGLFAGDGQIVAREGSHNVKIYAENLTCREVQPAKKKNHAAELLLNIVYRGTENSINSKADAVKPTSAYMLIVMLFQNHFVLDRTSFIPLLPLLLLLSLPPLLLYSLYSFATLLHLLLCYFTPFTPLLPLLLYSLYYFTPSTTLLPLLLYS